MKNFHLQSYLPLPEKRTHTLFKGICSLRTLAQSFDSAEPWGGSFPHKPFPEIPQAQLTPQDPGEHLKPDHPRGWKLVILSRQSLTSGSWIKLIKYSFYKIQLWINNTLYPINLPQIDRVLFLFLFSQCELEQVSCPPGPSQSCSKIKRWDPLSTNFHVYGTCVGKIPHSGVGERPRKQLPPGENK